MTTFDPSTLDFSKKATEDSLNQNRFRINVHVREDINQLIRMVTPRGIAIRIHGSDIHKNHLAEGNIITVYSENINPNELCRREYDELLDFVNTRLSVIRDNPYELHGGLDKTANRKIITEIDSEEKAQKAFNLEEENGKVFGQL